MILDSLHSPARSPPCSSASRDTFTYPSPLPIIDHPVANGNVINKQAGDGGKQQQRRPSFNNNNVSRSICEYLKTESGWKKPQVPRFAYDPSLWVYRNEGNQNLTVSSPVLHKVLRLRKKSSADGGVEAAHAVLPRVSSHF
jgi:hypothetical protein